MIKVIERNQTVERYYCDVCGERQCDQILRVGNLPKGHGYEYDKDMLMFCNKCIEYRVIPWLESQKIKPTV